MKIQNQTMIAYSVNRYQRNDKMIGKSIEKLSSGIKINRANDNASGLAISETMRAQMRGISQAQRNMQDGLSVLQAADEGLSHVNGLLQRARELSVMNASDTLTHEDRQASQIELNQLMEAINDTADKLEFNTKKILGENTPLELMVGSNPGQKITINLMDVSTEALDLQNVSLLTQENAEQLIKKMDKAITTITGHLTKIGSYYEAVEHHIKNAIVFESNLTTSISMLKDTEMAKEMTHYTSLSIRQKGDQLLVAEVNNSVKEILNLLS
ncbi:flagellin [Oikeobacillus pervagus]|uniref:Flagellin n=1 Tax=Oikeobacillus pervagus TaxID=1325931 RepID=A0AAJ1SY03_9BACI|nr:flagellin [Oikeobacillus pervagus]